MSGAEKRPIHGSGSNPKDRVGAKKLPLHLMPPAATAGIVEGLIDGAEKYGSFNWRDEDICSSVYLSAIQRHLDAFRDGEDNAPDSDVHHIKHVGATIAIMLDAMSLGRMVDDRPPPGSASKLHQQWALQQEERCAKVPPSPPDEEE